MSISWAWLRCGSGTWPVDSRYREMEAKGRAMLLEAGVPAEQVTVTRSAEMRLAGQFHDIVVPIA